MATAAREIRSRYVCDHCGKSYTAEEYDDLETICECNHMIVPEQDEPLPCGAISFPAPPPVQPAKKVAKSKDTRPFLPRRLADSSQPGQPVKIAFSPEVPQPGLQNLPTPSRKRALITPAAPEMVAGDAAHVLAVASLAASASPRCGGPPKKRGAADLDPQSSAAGGPPPMKARRIADRSFQAPPLKASVSASAPVLRKNSLLAKYLALRKRERREFVGNLSAAQQVTFATQLSAHEAGLV